jgi:hypothetical protein
MMAEPVFNLLVNDFLFEDAKAGVGIFVLIEGVELNAK